MCTIVASTQGLNGSWLGEVSIMGNRIRLVFNITSTSADNFSATMDSPDQGAKGIPTDIKVINPDSIELSIAQIGLTYKGRLVGEEIKGILHQGAFNLPMNLRQGTVTINRPQTPKPPFPYSTEEISFQNVEANATFSGTITYPVDFDSMKAHSVPLVVMVTGSGQQNRDEELFEHKPFLVIAHYLARNGIATLRYDDRGTGKSTGDFKKSTTFDNMKDALCAIKYAKGLDKFGKIGILGHSEGGSIAFMLAARKNADFIVSLAGPGVGGDSILISQNELLLRQNMLPEATIKDYCTMLKEVFSIKSKNIVTANPKATIDSIQKARSISIPASLRSNLYQILSMNNPWLSYFAAYNPAADLKKIKCPALILNGENDTQVTCIPNLNAIKASIPSGKNTVIKSFPRLNHLFQVSTTGSSNEYSKIEQTISPDVLTTIASWLNSLK